MFRNAKRACRAHLAHVGLADVGQRDEIPVPGRRGCAGSVGPEVGDRQLLASAGIDVFPDLFGLPRHQRRRRGRRRAGTFTNEVFGRHHPAAHGAEGRQHRRTRRGVLAEPRDLAACPGAVGQRGPERGGTAGRAHAVGAARVTSTAATACPSARPAARSLAVALPASNAAWRCWSAFNVISSTEAGNSSFSISADTPDSTASSDGYAGRSVAGTIARTPLSTRAGEGRL